MKLLLSSTLLASLCALSSWSVSSNTLVVIQTPDVSVVEGDTVIITCCWTQKLDRVTVNWLKNVTIIKKEDWRNKFQGSLKKDTNNCSSLSFPNITRDDSGRYICNLTVEIPVVESAKGNGTLITVMAFDSRDPDNNIGGDPVPVPVIAAVAVVVALFIITVACFCSLRKKRAQAAARVIYEVPHMDSEEAEMDKHSTSSSRGSSQWCQVPVYESVEYFQHAEAKGGE